MRRDDKDPSNIIYGLTDPTTSMIRYIGLSSRGLTRPREHRSHLSSATDTYCNRWLRLLKRNGLSFGVVVLEVLCNEVDLAEAERRWIAFGRTCGWPLTNTSSGGGLSEAALARKRERRAALQAEHEWQPSPSEVALRRWIWTCGHLPLDRQGVRSHCFLLFENDAALAIDQRSHRLIVDVVIEARVTFKAAAALHGEWLQRSSGKAVGLSLRRSSDRELAISRYTPWEDPGFVASNACRMFDAGMTGDVRTGPLCDATGLHDEWLRHGGSVTGTSEEICFAKEYGRSDRVVVTEDNYAGPITIVE